MNKITIFGRLTKDVEVNSTASGKKYGKFSIACTGKKKDESGERKVDFFDCVIFDKGAEIVEQYFKKGDPIFVVGQMESKRTSEGKVFWNVVVDEFDFVSGKKESKDVKSVEVAEEETANLPF